MTLTLWGGITVSTIVAMAIVVTALHIIKQNGHRHKRMINARLVAKVGCNIYQCFNLVRVFPVLVLFRSLPAIGQRNCWSCCTCWPDGTTPPCLLGFSQNAKKCCWRPTAAAYIYAAFESSLSNIIHNLIFIILTIQKYKSLLSVVPSVSCSHKHSVYRSGHSTANTFPAVICRKSVSSF